MTIKEEYKKILEESQKELKETENLIKDFEEIKSTYFKKFLPLEKALKDYGSFNGIHDAYGYEFISEKRFQKLCKLKEEKENSKTARYIDDIIRENQRHKAMLIERIEKLKSRVESD